MPWAAAFGEFVRIVMSTWKDVWVVTPRELVEYMRYPVDVTDYAAFRASVLYSNKGSMRRNLQEFAQPLENHPIRLW